MATGELGWVYTLHFERPYVPAGVKPGERLKVAEHYTGWAKDLDRRIAEHRAGGSSTAKLMQAVRAAGIDFVVAEVKAGTRSDERRAKGRGGASRRCPVCLARAKAELDALRPSARQGV